MEDEIKSCDVRITVIIGSDKLMASEIPFRNEGVSIKFEDFVRLVVKQIADDVGETYLSKRASK